MYRIVYGGFWQETNTFSPLICKREYFEAGGIYFDEQITKAMYGLKTTAIVTMAEVVENLYNKEYNGKVIIDDTLKAAIDAYYSQYGAE